MAAREPTAVEELREVAHYVDPALQPTLGELPALFTAFVEKARNSGVFDAVADLRKEGASDAEIRQEVAHSIAPPDPDANATVVQGVDPASHQQVVDELASLKQAIAELRSQRQPVQSNTSVGPVANPDELSAEQQELQQLREEVQSLRLQSATAQHPTATVEQVPDVPDETTPAGTGSDTEAG